MKTFLSIAVLLMSITSFSQSIEDKILLQEVKKRGIKTDINWTPQIGGFNFERKQNDYQIIYELRKHIKDSLDSDFKEQMNLIKARAEMEHKISTLNKLVEEYSTIYVTSDSYNYNWTKEDEEYLTPENKEKMASYNAEISRKKDEKKNFNNSFVENFKIKYKDYVVKCYNENKDYTLYSSDIKIEYLEGYEKTLGYNYSAGYDYPDENISEVMIKIKEDFKNSREYKDGEARRNARIRNGLAELSKAENTYNYNMTHLEKYSTPELRKIYMYFRDKKSFQAETELVRIELLKRK